MSEQSDFEESLINHQLLSTKDLVNSLLLYLSGPGMTYEHYELCKPALARLLQQEEHDHFFCVSKKIKERLGMPLQVIKDSIERLVLRPGRQPAANARPTPPVRQYLARFAGLIDVCHAANNTPVYLVKEGNELKVITQWEQQGVVYRPPTQDLLGWLLPSVEQVLAAYENDTADRLFADLVSWHLSISDLPTEEHAVLLAAWDLHAAILEHFTCSPYLWFYGPANRGKSRTGKSVTYVVPRGIHIETLRAANLIRASHHRAAVVFLDVVDVWRRACRNSCEDILLHRHERGARVERVLHPHKGQLQDSTLFDVYGATLIATNEPVPRVLESRCIPISMPEQRHDNLLDPDPQEGLKLRERVSCTTTFLRPPCAGRYNP